MDQLGREDLLALAAVAAVALEGRVRARQACLQGVPPGALRGAVFSASLGRRAACKA